MAARRAQRPSSTSTPRIFTVSELTGLVRTAIEAEFQELWLEGEISNLRMPGSGHVYCTLKDETSQIRAVLFRSSALRVRFTLQEGMQVVVRGRLTVYELRGEYQIVIETVEPKGIGALQLAFEQLKERLAAEGLFDQARKKLLPTFPKTVGIVTSLTGAAIRDMLTILRRRWPIIRIVIAPVQVQGEEAGRQIAEALASLNEWRLADVIIVGRGGGSLEDLWSFNEEVVVRAIAASSIPVVSAVGHEIDATLADFAADHRAPTPSAAAETVVPVLDEVVERLQGLTARTGQAMLYHCGSEHRRIERCRQGLAQIRFRIQEEAQRADEFTGQLANSLRSLVTGQRERIQEGRRALAVLSPMFSVKRELAMLPQFTKRLERQMYVVTVQRRQQIQAGIAQLHQLSPLAILGRGYSILSSVPGGNVVKTVRSIQAGDDLSAQLSDGRLDCSVRRVLPDPLV
jgi:exodeoxyribonuclease VII large subunit